MRLKAVGFSVLIFVLVAGLKAQEQSGYYVTAKQTWPVELGGGAGVFFVGLMALGPAEFVISDLDPLDSSTEWITTTFAVTAGTALAVGTGIGTWWSGRFAGDRGSLGGAIVGAAIGEAAWLAIPELLVMIPSKNVSIFDLDFIAHYACMALPPLGAFAGYKLIPPIGKKETSSLGFRVLPAIGDNGAGIAVCMNF